VDQFAQHHPMAVSDVPVRQELSTYPCAGEGMFASRFLHTGEVVVEYTGTWKTLSRAEFEKLIEIHGDDGNGVVELPKGRAKSAARTTRTVTCMDPYVGVDGAVRESKDAPGVWANHRCETDLGCNMQLKATR
jgi:hypothetical protein